MAVSNQLAQGHKLKLAAKEAHNDAQEYSSDEDSTPPDSDSDEDNSNIGDPKGTCFCFCFEFFYLNVPGDRHETGHTSFNLIMLQLSLY